MNTLVLDSAAVEEAITMEALIEAVRDAFGAYARNGVKMPAKSYIELPAYNGDFRSMPAYVEADSWDAAAVKWVNVHPDNPETTDLPTVMGTVIYSDPATGAPLAIMDGTELTRLRTGAAAGVATDYLAHPDASSFGLVGAGAQAYTQLAAVATVRDIDTVVVADADPDQVAAFIETFEDQYDVREGTIEEAVGCDVVSTCTPVTDPIVPAEALNEPTHVNAMGADAEGKQELDPAVLTDATVVIDDYEQCTHSGEINVPYNTGELTDEDIDAELGDVVTGDGEDYQSALTVFDSTGLAIQDVAAAHVAYERAREAGLGEDMVLLER